MISIIIPKEPDKIIIGLNFYRRMAVFYDPYPFHHNIDQRIGFNTRELLAFIRNRTNTAADLVAIRIMLKLPQI